MIKVSEMYRISGGCTIGKCCEDCANFINSKELLCINYPREYGTLWSGKRIACKYFRNREDDSQMDITDYLKSITE